MPEGDTILRAARVLGKALAGRTLTSVETSLPALHGHGLKGRVITDITAHGKSMLIHFDDGRVLHSHMRMTGSWHIYRPGERWQKPRQYARIILETDAYIAVCFSAPVVELLTPRGVAEHPSLTSLGPDILAPEFDVEEALRRLRTIDRAELGDALLDQRAVAGIGNIYKSETCFICRVNPFLPVGSYDDAQLTLILTRAREIMSANLDERAPRRTAFYADGQRFHVYKKSGSPCRACGTFIRMRRQGEAARSTYFCPRCQHVDVDAMGAPPTTRKP